MKIPTTMDEQWMHEMREKMADFEWSAPELSWDELDKALVANNPRKTHVLWLRSLAAAAVILLIAGVGYWVVLCDKSMQEHQTTSVSNQLQSKDDRGKAHDSDQQQHQIPIPMTLAKSIHKFSMTEDSVLVPETVIPVSADSFDSICTSASETKEQPYTVVDRAKSVNHTASVVYHTALHQRKHLDNRLTAKVYMSSTMADNHQMIIYSIQGGSLSPDVQTTQIEQDVHHHQPIRFGLLLRYQLDDQWSLESGLIYTRLSSDISTTMNNVTTLTEQHLNYIGLPLNISYDLWKNRHFNLYVTAGSTIEKRLDASPWQFSLNGASGAEYKLTDYFSLYAEPGLGYYFKDGSTTPTVYQDHPLNFNLSVGLRFNLK